MRARLGQSFVTALLVACLLGVVPAGSTAEPAAPAPTRILIVGDSIAQGAAGDWTWRYRLWRHLRRTGASVDLVGCRDDLFDMRTQRFGSQAYVDPAFDRDHCAKWGTAMTGSGPLVESQVRAHRADVVVVQLGVNDLLYGALTPLDLAATVDDLVARVRSGSVGASVVLVALGQDWVPGAAEANALLQARATSLDQPGSRVLVASPRLLKRRRDTWDGIHPSATGEVRIAAGVADGLAGLGIGVPYPDGRLAVANGPRTAPRLRGFSGRGRVALRWSRPPGVEAVVVWRRNATLGRPWQAYGRPSYGRGVLLGGLRRGHRYVFRVQPVRGWIRSRDVFSRRLTLTVT